MKNEVGSSELGFTMPVSRLTNDETQSPQEAAYDILTSDLGSSVLKLIDLVENEFEVFKLKTD